MIRSTPAIAHRVLIAGILTASVGLPAEKTGPLIGQTVPAFSATDQNGTQQTLRSVMGPKGALLVFFRSADW